MTAGLGPWGAAIAAGGTMAEGIGNGQALMAMEQVWKDALARQQGFDDKLDERTREYISRISPDLILGSQHINRTADSLKGSRDAVGEAIAINAARGGRHAGPAGTSQSLADVMRSQVDRDDLAARLGGFRQGGFDVAQLGMDMSGDRSRIIRDAQLWATLVPTQLKVAQHKGGNWRGIGQGAQAIGNGLMSWDMSQPGVGGEGMVEEPYASTEPLLAHQPGYDPNGVQAAGTTPARSMQPTYADLFGGYR